STQFGLPQFNTGDPKSPTLKVLPQDGNPSSPLPPDQGLGTEVAMDVEWAHAIAPRANIVVIECNSNSRGDMFAGVKTAGGISGVSVVSMSFGHVNQKEDLDLDSVFIAPGVTFLAATGDHGKPGVYPAYSPNVVAVGGTSLYLKLKQKPVNASGP